MKIFFAAFLAMAFLCVSCDNGQKATPESEDNKPKINVEEASKKMEQLKGSITEGKKAHKFKQKLREEIGMKSFNGNSVEVSQAEIFYDSSATVHIEVIYFKVVPIGMKRWYFDNGIPVAVESFDYEQADDATLTEKQLYKAFMSADESVYEFPNPAMEINAEKRTALTAELVKERQILKELADKYRPK
jgi:hypothetical protein